MKHFLPVCVFVFSCCLSFSQNVKTETKSKSHNNVYKRGFEIKGNESPDSVLLSIIDISTYEHLRQSMKRVEVYDAVSNSTLILYSTEEVCLIAPEDDPAPQKLITPSKR